MSLGKDFPLGIKIYLNKYYHIIILFFNIFHFVNCNSICKDLQNDLNDEKCFNNVIKFDSKKYRANNFATNKKGDLILELTELKEEEDNNEFSSSRLFYGITKDGYPFFKNNTSYTHEIKINKSKELFDDNNCNNLNKITNSINLFISLKNNLNKDNQYLFSINSHNCMVELFDLNEDNDIYYLWSFKQFFNLEFDDYFLFEYDLFVIEKKMSILPSFLALTKMLFLKI